MSDYEHAKREYRPLWPLEVYRDWIRRKAGTAEQQKRYAEAMAWYEAEERQGKAEMR